MVEDGGPRCRCAERLAGQRGKCVAEPIAADASHVDTKVSQKAAKLRDGSRLPGQRSPTLFSSLELLKWQ